MGRRSAGVALGGATDSSAATNESHEGELTTLLTLSVLLPSSGTG